MAARIAPVLVIAALVFVPLRTIAQEASPQVVEIPNGGFEEGLSHWTVPESDAGISKLSDVQVATGKQSLHLHDDDEKNGSWVESAPVEVDGAGVFEIRGKLFPIFGSGLGIYVHVRDKDGAMLPGDPHLRGLGGSEQKWIDFACPFYTTSEARTIRLVIHSYNSSRCEAYLDDLHFVRVSDIPTQPPWPAKYKLRPNDTARLTPADVVGPDGIVYPNWTKCGMQGGIPEVPVAARIEDFGGAANDDRDDSDALDRACIAVGEKGGGAVLLGEGTYHLDMPVTIRHSGVVIRGAGMDKTNVIFRYAIPEAGVAIFTPEPGGTIGPSTRVEMHCRPTDLQKMTLLIDDTVIGTWERGAHSGNTFNRVWSGRDILGKVPDGPHTLKAVAEYKDAPAIEVEQPVVLDANYTDTRRPPVATAAIGFYGTGWSGGKFELARDGLRGDMTLTLKSVEGLAVGDAIEINAPATERWKALTKNLCPWGTYRRYHARVDGIEGNTVTLNQPLRIDFPVIDGSYIQKVGVITGCGVEGFTLEQTENLWITSVQFYHAWNCFARGVKTKMCGRNPVYASASKWCEFRDCVFDDAWFKGGGGTAYVGWENCYDCLMAQCESFKMRHGPLYQWAASGCVIRDSVFHESDGQWHSGWTNENLFEQCIVESSAGNGGYGYGMWASPPEDTAHGPNGPRNVVYNCDVRSTRAGLWMGGMNENWLILYNRFIADTGPGVFCKTASFDHIIKGNVFVMRDEKSPMAQIATPDCLGIELIGNLFYGGNGKLHDGAVVPAVVEDNQALPLADADRPTPPVPSIYLWQQEHAADG